MSDENQKYMQKEEAKMAMGNAITDYIKSAEEAGFDHDYIRQELSDVLDESSDGKFQIG